MITLDQIIDVIQRHYPYPWAKDSTIVLNWLVWFIKKRFAICVSDDNENISGLCLLRPMMNATDGLWTYRYDHEGPVIYCDFAYAAHNQAARGILIESIKRFGRRETFAWQRKGVLKSYPAHKFVRQILKEKENVPA